MTAADILTYASYTELNQLAAKDNPEQFLAYLNLGMNELHKRFMLISKEQLISLNTGETEYSLNSDCMRVAGIYDDTGTELSINDEEDLTGVMLPEPFTLQIPFARTGLEISVIYYGSPTPITDLAQDVLLPPQMLEALLNYIGYRAHSAINGGFQTEGNAHYKKFEDSCRELKHYGLVQEDATSDNKFSERGWV